MNRRFVIVLIAGGVLIAGVWVVLNQIARPAAPPATAVRETPPPSKAVEAPSAPNPTPASEPEAPRRSPRRPAAPKPEATPAPAPAAPDAPADVATLRIDSDVPGAQVFIDREFIGQAPVTAQNVKPGSHRINVSAPGYEGVADTIEVTPGSRAITIRLKDIRLDATLDVVHKHRIGSCKGRLTATPQGIRYETTDKDDGFRAALLEMETFEVDYLKKNLRVKLRKGRQYDFTDPDGNADRLFVFHRDVAKAVDRLRKGDAPAK
jgi:hypothetical protein